jgi:hypothetical protein
VFLFDDVPFERRLAETIAWCAARVSADDPKQSLRSEALCPNVLAPDRADMVRSVATCRARSVRDTADVSHRESLRGGRLLIYFPDANLADGAAEVQSRGFFDMHNVPAWDTWVALADDRPEVADPYFQQYVVAWVPPELVEAANAGINVNPEECISWLDSSRAVARRELERLLR